MAHHSAEFPEGAELRREIQRIRGAIAYVRAWRDGSTFLLMLCVSIAGFFGLTGLLVALVIATQGFSWDRIMELRYFVAANVVMVIFGISLVYHSAAAAQQHLADRRLSPAQPGRFAEDMEFLNGSGFAELFISQQLDFDRFISEVGPMHRFKYGLRYPRSLEEQVRLFGPAIDYFSETADGQPFRRNYRLFLNRLFQLVIVFAGLYQASTELSTAVGVITAVGMLLILCGFYASMRSGWRLGNHGAEFHLEAALDFYHKRGNLDIDEEV